MHVSVVPHILQFKRPAGTSRGAYTVRKIWCVVITDLQNPSRLGVGECAPLVQLSCDDVPNYEEVLNDACKDLEQTGRVDYDKYLAYPSIIFGLEVALRHYEQGSLALWDTPFSREEKGIPINGLIWMGSFEYMHEQIEQKLEAGFRCVKLKIGAIDFEKELALLKYIRKHFGADTIQLRVDANGAFKPNEALKKLKQLSEFDLHSIEQPIEVKQWDVLADLCKNTPLPIALDEELIGVHYRGDKIKLLDTIKPQYIILKPSLHGGLRGSEEWIELATERGIDYWITSALESNVGLNAIAQWTATFNPTLYQGLGTGLLYEDNVNIPLEIREDKLWFNHQDMADVDFTRWIG